MKDNNTAQTMTNRKMMESQVSEYRNNVQAIRERMAREANSNMSEGGYNGWTNQITWEVSANLGNRYEETIEELNKKYGEHDIRILRLQSIINEDLLESFENYDLGIARHLVRLSLEGINFHEIAAAQLDINYDNRRDLKSEAVGISTEYNGWTNYTTWSISSNYGELISQIAEQNITQPFRAVEDRIAYYVHNLKENLVEELIEGINFDSYFFESILTSCLENVNWTELAVEYVNFNAYEIEEDEPEDDDEDESAELLEALRADGADVTTNTDPELWNLLFPMEDEPFEVEPYQN